MAVAIKIRQARQPPAGQKSGAGRAADVNVVVQVPDRRLTGAGVIKHIVRFPIAVKVDALSQPAVGAPAKS